MTRINKYVLNKFTIKKLLFAFLTVFFCCGYSDGKYYPGPFLWLSNNGLQKKILVQILDEHGKPTAAKIRVTELDSIYYAPDGHLSDFNISEGGGDAMLANKRRFAYVEGTFGINLPVANIRFEVVKGYAYYFFDSTITISSETDTIKIQLQKWFEFDNEKWYSGDVHVHYIDPVTALLEMKAEDLNVCNILTSDFTNDQDRFRGATDPVSDSTHLIYINQEYREDQLGHVNLLNLKKLIEPVKTMRKYHYPLNMQACDETHAQGGHVSWAHFAAWPGLEAPLAIVMKKIDAVELLCTIDPFNEPIFVSEVVPDLRMNSGLRLWYRLLNCGLKVPATAGTDKMNNRVTVGANRVYALIKGNFNYQSWIDAINRGNTFITNSPFLICHANNKSPGEKINISRNKTVTIIAEMWSQLPVDRLEIIANGEVIADKIIEKGQHYAKLKIEYKPVKSVWIAARTHQYNQEDTRNGVSFSQRRDLGAGPTLLNKFYGTMRPETAFAHTSPTYVIVENQPIHSKADAEYFIKYLENVIIWLKQTGRFPSVQAKEEVLAAFKKGIDEFMKLANYKNK
jgi:hypothetical protein